MSSQFYTFVCYINVNNKMYDLLLRFEIKLSSVTLQDKSRALVYVENDFSGFMIMVFETHVVCGMC